jgi:polyisoprenyl-teichoic acid--peptidoglycan teichoic acid transferase
VSWMPQTRGGALWRFALAAVLVILFAATTTAVAGLLQVKQLAHFISETAALPHAQITVADAGKPQTLLLIGSDHRANTPFSSANTDTMMLVRLDASSQTINVISVPRDLKVLLPEGGVKVHNKLNAAYSLGGPNLLVKTLESQVFPGLTINHIIDVNFGGFKALVDAVGCVYADVDHRYYNNTAFTDYSSIDIQPGYQRLCDDDALAFVRFRHTDSDLVRNARQQDFLRWAKSQFSSSTLLGERNKLVSIFGKHAQTDGDLHTTDGLLKLFDLVAFSAGHTVKQIPFPAILQNCASGPGVQTPCYVTADPGPEAKAYRAFLTPTQAHPSNGHNGGGGHHGPPAPPPVMGDINDGRMQASLLSGAGNRMPVYVPGKIADGSHYCAQGTCSEGPVANSYPRAYTIHDQTQHPYAAYRLTLVLNPILGQYYGIQGMTWQNPPILDGAHLTRFVNGKQLLEYFDGSKLTLVAWHAPGGLVWVSNTLTDNLSNQQMVAIAASLTKVSG